MTLQCKVDVTCTLLIRNKNVILRLSPKPKSISTERIENVILRLLKILPVYDAMGRVAFTKEARRH